MRSKLMFLALVLFTTITRVQAQDIDRAADYSPKCLIKSVATNDSPSKQLGVYEQVNVSNRKYLATYDFPKTFSLDHEGVRVVIKRSNRQFSVYAADVDSEGTLSEVLFTKLNFSSVKIRGKLIVTCGDFN